MNPVSRAVGYWWDSNRKMGNVVLRPLRLTRMDGRIERPDPYTEIVYRKVGGAPPWAQVALMAYSIPLYIFLIEFAHALATTGTAEAAIGGISGSVEVFGYPLFFWWLVGYFAFGIVGILFFEPVRLEKEVRSAGPPTDYWDTLWAFDLQCRIDDGRLVPAGDTLVCRECGARHTYGGDLVG